MVYLLYNWLYDPDSIFSFMRLISYISFRSIFAFISGFGIVLIFGKWIITMLLQKGIRENIRTYGDVTDPCKKGTPTMGGIIIAAAILIPVLIWANLGNRFIQRF